MSTSNVFIVDDEIGVEGTKVAVTAKLPEPLNGVARTPYLTDDISARMSAALFGELSTG